MTIFLSLIFFTSTSFANIQIVPFQESDLDLVFKTTALSKKPAVIYSWSPHMNLSVKGLSELIAYCSRNGIQTIVVIDPDANFEMAKEIVIKNKWPSEYLRPNKSLSLMKRGTRVHYPSYHFISNGKFARPPLPGYKLSQELDEFRKGARR